LLNRKHKLFIDQTSPETAHLFGVNNFLVSRQTEYQQVEIADTEMYGRMLILDGKIQSSELDEYIYHEALVHPAMLMCPAPRRVLVIGGGEGATLREVLKHPGVEKVVMVDLDREVVDLCRNYLTSWHRGCFEDRRVALHFMDAREYLEKNDALHDVIISDVPEPVEEGPALKLFTRQYFDLIKNRLADKGVFSLQAGDFSLPFIEIHSAVRNTIKEAMGFVRSYRAFVPSFNTEWGFILAAPRKNELPGGDIFMQMIRERKLNLSYLNEESSAGMFLLPADVRRRLEQETRVIDDEELISIY